MFHSILIFFLDKVSLTYYQIQAKGAPARLVDEPVGWFEMSYINLDTSHLQYLKHPYCAAIQSNDCEYLFALPLYCLCQASLPHQLVSSIHRTIPKMLFCS